MKKTLAAVVVAAVLVACGLAYAQAPARAYGGQADVNAFKQFQKETLPLRDEMQVKRLELRNEFAKQAPDENRIAQLQKEMIDLRAKISSAADKNGVQGYGYGRMGYGWMGYGAGNGRGWGRGPRMGGCGYFGGPGYGRGPAL
jgi:Spy/CpxP family protein refolding chaperone